MDRVALRERFIAALEAGSDEEIGKIALCHRSSGDSYYTFLETYREIVAPRADLSDPTALLLHAEYLAHPSSPDYNPLKAGMLMRQACNLGKRRAYEVCGDWFYGNPVSPFKKDERYALKKYEKGASLGSAYCLLGAATIRCLSEDPLVRDHNEGFRYIKALLDICPNYKKVWLLLGLTYMQQEDKRIGRLMAVRAFERGVVLGSKRCLRELEKVYDGSTWSKLLDIAAIAGDSMVTYAVKRISRELGPRLKRARERKRIKT